jgi:hypothetical protein
MCKYTGYFRISNQKSNHVSYLYTPPSPHKAIHAGRHSRTSICASDMRAIELAATDTAQGSVLGPTLFSKV